jgi:multicomponent Na+:H+ antiporter subunit D
LPASYHTPPVAVTALFAGLLTKVGVYSLIRVFTLIFVAEVGYTHRIILWTAGLTMLVGVIGAVSQHDMRRILSFHIVSQIGYMVMGLGMYTRLAIAGSVFYVIHHIIVKTTLFLTGGLIEHVGGTSRLSRLGGMITSAPVVAVLFLVPALSLAGVPPLSGFVTKLAVIEAGMDADEYVLVGVSLLVGLLTLFSMMKIWAGVFWNPRPTGELIAHDGPGPWLMIAPTVVLIILSLAVAIAAGPLIELSERAASDLLHPQSYVKAVLG